jgi:NTE family protein
MSWGLVLSGGAAYGIANVGVLEVLEEEGLKPDCIAGSSMGAIVGGLYALGYAPSVLRDLCSKLELMKIVERNTESLRKGLHVGLLSPTLETHLEHLVGNAKLSDCKIPFVCVAGKVREPIEWTRILQKGFTEHVTERVEPYVFPPETRMIDAMKASSAIPVVFSPVKIGNDEFIDLVHFGAIPARTLRDTFHPDKIIATDTMPQYKGIRWMLPHSWREFLDTGYMEIAKSRNICNVVIRPKLRGRPYRFDKAMEFVEDGRTATEKALPQIRTILQSTDVVR